MSSDSLSAFSLKFNPSDAQTIKIRSITDSDVQYIYQLCDQAISWALENKDQLLPLASPINGSFKTYYISKDFNDWKLKNVISLIIGISIGIFISFMTPAKENDNLWFVFLCGIIGVSGMTLPGLSGSFILILLGNYVLLLVDSVNVLGSVVTNTLSGNFEFLKDQVKIRYLKIITVFTAGSAFGLVSISHVLGYVLKRWHQIVTAIIIGFITGSLGIVWPWKKTIFKLESGTFLLDQKGNKIVENYERFIPDFSTQETWIATSFIIFGIALILIIDFYGRKRK